MNNYISTYALYHPNDAYLEHGLSWGKHRYIKRTGTPGNYKYTYAEDLRNAGRNLASGARNLVSRAGTAVGKALGVPQKKNYERASAELDKWRNRWYDRNFISRRFENDVQGNKGRPISYIQKQEARALDNAVRAHQAYNKTPLGMVQKVASDLDYVAWDVSNTAKKYLKSAGQKISELPGLASDAFKSIDNALGKAVMSREIKDLDSRGYRMVSKLSFTDIISSIVRGRPFMYTIENKLTGPTARSRRRRLQKRDQRAAEGRQNHAFRGLLREQKLYEQKIPETKIREQFFK